MTGHSWTLKNEKFLLLDDALRATWACVSRDRHSGDLVFVEEDNAEFAAFILAGDLGWSIDCVVCVMRSSRAQKTLQRHEH